MKKLAFIYVIAAGVFWGTSALFSSWLRPYGFSPIQMTAMRGTVAAISMSLYALIANKKLFKITLKELVIFACSGLAVFGTATCYYAAMEASSVSTAVVLMYTAPVLVMAYSVAFLGEKLNLPKIISVVCMIIGCALVSGVVGGMDFSPMGIILGFASGIIYSVYNILTKIEMMHKSNSVSASLYCFIFMALAALAFCDPVGLVTITATDPAVIVPLIIGIGVCTCVLPYFLYTLSLRDIPVGTASALSIVEPMSATVFSIVFLGEVLSIPSICGIVLILGAVFMLNKSDS